MTWRALLGTSSQIIAWGKIPDAELRAGTTQFNVFMVLLVAVAAAVLIASAVDRLLARRAPVVAVRTAALVPPPRYPLVRYSGVLGPGAKLRARIVPMPTRTRAKRCPAEPLPPREKPGKPEKTSRDDSSASLVLANVAREPEPTEWNILTLSHWNRLANGALVAATRTIDWRTLLARTFGFDAMRCPRCGAPLRIVATITNPDVARAIVDHVRSARAPPHAA